MYPQRVSLPAGPLSTFVNPSLPVIPSVSFFSPGRPYIILLRLPTCVRLLPSLMSVSIAPTSPLLGCLFLLHQNV
jgi:hypothetical protein